MNSKKCFSFAMVLAFAMATSLSQAQVQVRVMAATWGNPSTSHIPTRMARIQEVLDNSSLGITVDLVGGGAPAPIQGLISLPGTDEEFVENLIDETDLMAWRNANAADIVFVFVDSLVGFRRCGFAPNFNWTNGAGMWPIAGPDTRGSENYFVALIATETTPANCRGETDLAAHEFGHLFGAAHEGVNGDLGLLPSPTESYADLENPNAVPGNGSYTVMATMGLLPNGGPSIFCSLPGDCDAHSRFSSTSTSSNPPSGGLNRYNNKLALSFTAYSVSLYRTPPPCGLTPPTVVNGRKLDICYGGTTETRHEVWWEDVCPSAVTNYRIEYKQPSWVLSQPYQHLTSVPVLTSKVIFLVNGASSNIKAKSCDFQSCSARSNDSYHAEWESECH